MKMQIKRVVARPNPKYKGLKVFLNNLSHIIVRRFRISLFVLAGFLSLSIVGKTLVKTPHIVALCTYTKQLNSID